MVKAKSFVFWGVLGVLGYLAAKKALAGVDGAYQTGRRLGQRGNGGVGRAPHRLGTASLGRAEAYSDAFPEEGLGGTEPWR